MSYFAGLDVSLRSVSICVIDGDGKIALERTVPFEIEDVIACLRSPSRQLSMIHRGSNPLGPLVHISV